MKKIEELDSKELLELYLKNKEFINFLSKEYKNTEKIKESK